MSRMIRVSVLPPKNPAMAPSHSPMTSDMAVAMKPIRSDIRAP